MRKVYGLLSVIGLLAGLSVPAQAAIKVGLVLDRGGKDDKSFNASAYQGLLQCKSKFGVETKVVEAPDDTSYETLLRSFAQKDYDLIIAVGFAQAEAVKKVAPQFPKKHFALVDSTVDAANVRSLMFEEHEGSFLVGAIAAMTSKTGKAGFIGGMDIPLIRRFEKGFEAGVKKMNPKASVVSNFVGVTGEAWNNPPKAKELALAQFQAGADVVFSAAGASNMGVFDAVEEKAGKLAIGCDSNQNWVKPGRIVTSMIKRVDAAVVDTCEAVTKNQFVGGVKRFGLANGGVDFALDQNNEKLLSPAMVQKINDVKKGIITGKIQVPDYYKKKGNG
jgi:basic membrane protein A